MRAVLLAGGMGKRLAPYTTVLPKPLIPVGDMPILEIVLRQLKSHGFNRVTICVGYLGSLLQAYFGNGEKLGIEIDYSFEDKPLGTAAPLKLVKDIDEPFLMMNGDILTTLSYSEMFEFHKTHGNIATIGITNKTVKIDLGVIHFNKADVITDYEEKPQLQYHVSIGIYVFQPEILNHIPDGIYFDLPDLINKLIAESTEVKVYNRECDWLDIGRKEDYELASESFFKNKDKFLAGCDL